MAILLSQGQPNGAVPYGYKIGGIPCCKVGVTVSFTFLSCTQRIFGRTLPMKIFCCRASI
jgi:hypothetical protein